MPESRQSRVPLEVLRMFHAIAIALVLLVAAALVVVPRRFPSTARWALGLVRRKLLDPSRPAVFRGSGEDEARGLLWVRVWSSLSAALLVLVALAVGFPGPDGPRLLGRSIGVAIAGIVAGTGTLFAFLAGLRFIPASRRESALRHHGFRSLWAVPAERPPQELLDLLPGKAKTSTVIRVLDVTGHELIGKGPGPSGGLLHDTLASMVAVPAEVLLLDPETLVPDPEHKHATVFQAVLGDLEMTPATYRRKIRTTLDAVEALNEKRAPEAKIRVRLYGEKPSFRMIVFDDSAFVSAWLPGDSTPSYPLLEVARSSPGPSLYDGFRREFARYWRAAEGGRSASSLRAPSTVVRRKPVAEPAEPVEA